MSILMESVEFAIFYDKLSLFVEKEKLVGSVISKSNKDKFYWRLISLTREVCLN